MGLCCERLEYVGEAPDVAFKPLEDTDKEAHYTGTSISLEKRASLNMANMKQFRQIEYIREYYKLGDELGHGAFGEVYEATHKVTKVQVAIKVIKKKMLMQNSTLMELMR